MLVYSAEQAPSEQQIIRDCLAYGKPYPKAIANAPEIEEHEVWYYRAYLDLVTSRAYEGGPIPFFAVIDYATRFGADDEQAERLFEVISQVDAGYNAHIKAKEDKGRKPPRKRTRRK